MQLLTGSAGSGKTARVLREFREALQTEHRGLRILVPTATLSEHLRNELARDGAVLRSRSVSTLARFIGELSPSAHEVNDAHFHLMVESAVLRIDRPEFRAVRELAGLYSRIAGTLSHLDAAGCTPAKLARVSRRLAPFRDAILAVWEDVERQMRERHAVTRGALLRSVASDLDRLELPGRIWMDGFAQLSGPEMDLICALGARTRITVTLPDEGVPAELKRKLIARGFEEERLPGGRVPETVLTTPETAEREVEEIARRILLGLGQGIPLRDTGVVVRQPDRYEPLLRGTLERFGIPAHFYFNEPLGKHPAGRLLSGTIDALLKGWDHEETLGLLRLVPVAGVSNALDETELTIRAALPGKGLDAFRQAGRANRNLARVLDRMTELEEWLRMTKTPASWAETVEGLASFSWPGIIPDQVSADEVARYRSFAAGLRAFTEAMRTSAAWWSSDAKPVRLTEFWQVAQTVVRLSTVTLPRRSFDAVHILSTYEARQWDLSTVFVCGLVEREFPAQNGGDPFFPDAALRDLMKEGVQARTSVDKDDEERALFEAACARARDRLVLSSPLIDGRGQRNLPSIFLNDREPDEATPPAVRPATEPPVAQWRQPVSIKSPDLIAALTANHTELSVTALESLLQCPFQFFAKRALRVSEMPERPENRLSFLLQGNIVHEVLKDWFAEKSPIEPLFQATFDRTCARENVVPGFRRERWRRALLFALQRFVNSRVYPLVWPAETEREFAVAIDSGLTIRGRLDRVDTLADGRGVIIDYKFSRAANTKNKVEDESKLQGPLYAMALERAFGQEAAAMIYCSLKDDKLSHHGWGEVPGVDLKLQPMTAEWAGDALHRVRGALAEFRSGVIHPRPMKLDPCRFCAYRDACRVGQPVAMPASGV